MKLYFQNSLGEKRLIGEPVDKKELVSEIHSFLNERSFTSFYMNVCEYESEKLRIDVGSWSEFFYVDGMSLKEWSEKNV